MRGSQWNHSEPEQRTLVLREQRASVEEERQRSQKSHELSQHLMSSELQYEATGASEV